MKRALVLGAGVGLAVVIGTVAMAAESSKEESKQPAPAPAPAPALPPLETRLEGVVDEAALGPKDREILGWAEACAGELGKTLEGWIDAGAISEERLFSRLYYPIPKTDPLKYKTDYDALSDRDVSPIQERYLSKSLALSYAVLTDLNGYVPTHNQKLSQPLTGQTAVDLVNNRTKRIFMTSVAFRAARSELPFLVQLYHRDNGERDLQLSVPVKVKGKRWGAVRFGYRPTEK